MTECVGGPLDGSFQAWDKEHVCGKMKDGKFCIYYLIDGKYRYQQTVKEDDLEVVEKAPE